MVSMVSNGIRVSVETSYQEAQSNPLAHQFVFAYRIKIENHNDFPIKLLSRLWYIFDSNSERRDVEGEGVVGLQPVINPGSSFEYVSGCPLTTEMGRMVGFYWLENQKDMSRFEVQVPSFELIAPLKMN
ncbi:MAG: Co2+/Mg2+ efflux protein ApaG [Chitinophagaceae bacterium]